MASADEAMEALRKRIAALERDAKKPKTAFMRKERQQRLY
jgi:prefoldin subunit 5